MAKKQNVSVVCLPDRVVRAYMKALTAIHYYSQTKLSRIVRPFAWSVQKRWKRYACLTEKSYREAVLKRSFLQTTAQTEKPAEPQFVKIVQIGQNRAVEANWVYCPCTKLY